jgi:hypothetical protein
MSYFHGQGGHCNRHFKKAGWSTPVQLDTSREDEAAARNLANRISTELPDRSGGGYRGPDNSFSPLFYPHFFIRHWLDCLDFHWRIGAALVSRSTAI